MNNDQLKEIIEFYVDDVETLNKIVVLEGDEFADGCIGITEDYQLVYSYDKLAESIARNDNISIEDAIDFIEYNTIRSLSYIQSSGLIAPIIIHEFENTGDD